MNIIVPHFTKFSQLKEVRKWPMTAEWLMQGVTEPNQNQGVGDGFPRICISYGTKGLVEMILENGSRVKSILG